MRDVVIVVTFAVTAICIAFVTAYRPVGFYEGRLVDWLQALGTLLASGVAVFALMTWRRADVARRNSETARDVMRAFSRLEAAALAARHRNFYPASMNGDDKKDLLIFAFEQLQAKVTPEQLDVLRNRIDEAETYMAEVRKIFDERSGNHLFHLVSLCRLVDSELENLPTLISPNAMYAATPGHLKWLEMAAPILGQLQMESIHKPPLDHFEQSIKSSGDALRTHVSQWL